MHKRPINILLAGVFLSGVHSLVCALLCDAASEESPQSSLKKQAAKIDLGDRPAKKKILHGGLQTKVDLSKASPLTHLPSEWNGVWQGSVPLQVLKGRVNLDASKDSKVEMLLKLETAKSDTTSFDLVLRAPQLVGAQTAQADIEPDIQYWQGHFRTKNKASVTVTGNENSRSGPASGVVSTMGKAFGQESRAPSIVFQGDIRGTFVMNTPKPQTGTDTTAGKIPVGGINYDNGANVTNGLTVFRCRYFKSDDRMAMNGAIIQADRIDIGNAVFYPGGEQVTVTGDKKTGFVLKKASGSTVHWSPEQISGATTNQPQQIIKPDSQIQIVSVAPNVYDAKSVNTIHAPHGGNRAVSMRMKALSANKVMVQMTVENFDQGGRLTNSFKADGYLQKR